MSSTATSPKDYLTRIAYRHQTDDSRKLIPPMISPEDCWVRSWIRTYIIPGNKACNDTLSNSTKALIKVDRLLTWYKWAPNYNAHSVLGTLNTIESPFGHAPLHLILCMYDMMVHTANSALHAGFQMCTSRSSWTRLASLAPELVKLVCSRYAS